MGLKHGTKDWVKFFDCAAVDSGRIPKYVLNDANDNTLATQMPEFFRTISGQAPPRVEGHGVSYSTWCRAKDLRIWANTLEAQQKLPALVELGHGST